MIFTGKTNIKKAVVHKDGVLDAVESVNRILRLERLNVGKVDLPGIEEEFDSAVGVRKAQIVQGRAAIVHLQASEVVAYGNAR